MKHGKENLTRREFFGSWRRLLQNKTQHLPEPRALPGFLRPPGALPEAAFVAKCDRACTACLDACPVDCIVQLGPAYGDKDKTPVILPRSRACAMCEEVPCAAACPTGALLPIQREEIALGTALIKEKSCFAFQGQPCDYCLIHCPLPAKAIVMNDGKPEVLEEDCTGCGQCLYICPAPGEGAIEINGAGCTTRAWEGIPALTPSDRTTPSSATHVDCKASSSG